MRLGIDFGTTHTVAALVDRGNYPLVSFEAGDFIPSLIAVRDRDGDLRFGWEAAEAAHDGGWHLLRSFKRLLPSAGPLTRVVAGGHEFLLADLLTLFFSNLKWELCQRSNAGVKKGEPLEVAVSVPANALGAQRFLTVDAFRRAGFEVIMVLNEPSAAGFEYHHRHRKTLAGRREYILVYDLGGGTFDSSLIHMAGCANEVLASAGVSRLGGDDFDEAILALVLARAGLPEPPEDVREALLEEVRERKEAVEANTRRFVVDLGPVDLPPLTIPVEEVYEACRPLVEGTMEVMDPLVRDLYAGRGGAVTWNDVASVYTVGGASHFPPVYRLLRERFGTTRVRRSPHPFAATAIGLAICLDEGAGWRLADRLTRHFGVWRETQEGRGVYFDVIFPRGVSLPGPADHPMSAVRRYRAAHNVGHYRFVESSRIRDGEPAGDLLAWGEIRFPFQASLRDEPDLSVVPVSRLAGEGPEVEERYWCEASGIIEVTLSLPGEGYSRTYRISPPGA
jgi:molecular chaperone DnaK